MQPLVFRTQFEKSDNLVYKFRENVEQIINNVNELCYLYQNDKSVKNSIEQISQLYTNLDSVIDNLSR